VAPESGSFGASRHVDVGARWQVYHWCRKWGCTEAELREVVARVGGAAEQVDRALAERFRDVHAEEGGDGN